MNKLRWSETPPTEPGFYWVKYGMGPKRIIELPHCGTWPEHWQKLRAATIEFAPAKKQTELEKLPESVWKIQWAGPIPEPEN